MKRWVCWLVGHKWITRPWQVIQQEIGHGQDPRLVECKRCGATEP